VPVSAGAGDAAVHAGAIGGGRAAEEGVGVATGCPLARAEGAGHVRDAAGGVRPNGHASWPASDGGGPGWSLGGSGSRAGTAAVAEKAGCPKLWYWMEGPPNAARALVTSFNSSPVTDCLLAMHRQASVGVLLVADRKEWSIRLNNGLTLS